jgi:hypothetical protein
LYAANAFIVFVYFKVQLRNATLLLVVIQCGYTCTAFKGFEQIILLHKMGY